ncbi:MAG: ABC transporter substrate-binding protein [bacterium]|nr:ABC transporter substrate-binding protein [bacterium]
MRSLLLLICLALLSAPSAQAQSFLSYPTQPEVEAQGGFFGQAKKERLRLLGSLNPEQEAPELPAEVPAPALVVPELPFTLESLEQIEAQAQRGESNLALATLQALPRRPDGEKFVLEERRYATEIRLLFELGRYAEVSEKARYFLRQWGGGSNFHQVYFRLAQSLAKQGQLLESTSLVDEEFFTALAPSEAMTLRDLLIRDALKRSKVYEAFSYLETFDQGLIPEYQRWAGEIIDQFNNQGDLDDLIERYTANPWLTARLKLRKIQLWVRTVEFDKAQAYLTDLLKDGGIDPKLYAEFVALGGFIENASQTRPYRIGVILPFSHKRFGHLAQQVLEGLEIGLARFATAEQPIELVLKDSARDAGGETRMGKERRDLIGELVRELVLEDKVVAILGPLAKDTSIAAGEAAEPYKIPVISFSLTENLGEDLPFLFRYQRNDLQEAQVIAHYAADYLQAKRVVVLYHPDKTGFRRMETFVKTFREQGGQIVGVRPIGARQVDFQEDFASFTGGFKPISEEDRAEMEKTRDRIDPEVDFDAIYAPVRPYTMNILTQFAALFEAEKIYFLAGHELNEAENQLIDSAAKLRFADSYPISGANTYLLPFFESHWRHYNHVPRYRPPTSYGVYGYEALEILTELLKDPNNHNREVLRDALAGLKEFPVISGKVTTLSNGELQKDLKILKVQGTNTVEVF